MQISIFCPFWQPMIAFFPLKRVAELLKCFFLRDHERKLVKSLLPKQILNLARMGAMAKAYKSLTRHRKIVLRRRLFALLLVRAQFIFLYRPIGCRAQIRHVRIYCEIALSCLANSATITNCNIYKVGFPFRIVSHSY